MASVEDDTVFPIEELDDDDDDESQEEEEEEDDEHDASPSTSSAHAVAASSVAITHAVPVSSFPNGGNAVISTPTASPVIVAEPQRQRLEQIDEKKPLDDSRKLFQRLWTDEDEIGLLQGFLEYTAQRGSSHHNDTSLFYDQIKCKLQLDFNKNQLVEKLRRLKKKYRNVLSKICSGKEFSFKSPHDQTTFEISRKIWSDVGSTPGAPEDNGLDDDEIHLNPNFSPSIVKNEAAIGNSAEKKPQSSSRKRSRSRSGMNSDEKRELNDGVTSNKEYNITSNTNNNHSNNHNVPKLIEETVRNSVSPLVRELLNSSMGGPFGARGFGGMAFNPLPLYSSGPSMMNLGIGEVMDEKWRKQQILELEVYSKRLELVQDQIKTSLEELRSSGR